MEKIAIFYFRILFKKYGIQMNFMVYGMPPSHSVQKQKDEGDDDDDVSVEKEAAQKKTEPETEHKPFESAKMGGGAAIESVGIEHEKDNHVKTRVRQTSDRRDDRKKIVESKGQRKREGRLEEVSKVMNGILESVEEEEVEVEEEEEEPVVSEEEV